MNIFPEGLTKLFSKKNSSVAPVGPDANSQGVDLKAARDAEFKPILQPFDPSQTVIRPIDAAANKTPAAETPDKPAV